jgi:hypothetical protein
LTIDQLRPSNSHNGARNFGKGPSNKRYHRAIINIIYKRKILVIGICEALSLGPDTTLSKAGGSSNAGGSSKAGGPSDELEPACPCSETDALDGPAVAFPFEPQENGIP